MSDPIPWPTPAAESGDQSYDVLPSGEVNLYRQDPTKVRVGSSPRGWDDDTLGGEADDR